MEQGLFAGMQGEELKAFTRLGVPPWAAFLSYPGSGAPTCLSAALGTPGRASHHVWHLCRFAVSLL